MTYYQFIVAFNTEWSGKHRNVIYVCGGSENMHVDVLRILEKRLNKKKLTKQTVHMTEFVGNEPNPAFLFSLFDLKVILWAPGVLEKSKWNHFLRELQKAYGVTVIIDESGELHDVFKKEYGKGSSGVIVDCRKFPNDLPGFILLEMGNMAGIRLSDDIIKHLLDVPFDALYSIFSVLRYLGIQNLGVEEAKKYGILTSNVELIYVKKLMSKGKQAILQYSFDDIDEGRFLRFLCFELIRLLRLKTMTDRTMVMAQELKIPYPVFKNYYLPLADRLDLQTLYNRLNLVLTLLTWSKMPGISTMLLVYWR